MYLEIGSPVWPASIVTAAVASATVVWQIQVNIATVKITDKNIRLDTKGKDTWQHTEGGSKLTILSSPVETDFIIKSSKKINEIIDYILKFDEFDVILIEGINDRKTPKIRIGDIKPRENTIITYKGDFNHLIKIIKNEIVKRRKK